MRHYLLSGSYYVNENQAYNQSRVDIRERITGCMWSHTLHMRQAAFQSILIFP